MTEFIWEIMNLDITEEIGMYQKKGQEYLDEAICRLTKGARIREVGEYVYENPQVRKLGFELRKKVCVSK